MPMSEAQWRTLDIVVKGIGAAVITGCITLLGIYIQTEQNKLAQQKERLQALVDFNSAQKNLDVNVGMQLFSKFVDHYLGPASSGNQADRQTLLMLRLLALNFQDVPINLKPLFEDLDFRLRQSTSGTVGSAVGIHLQDELRGVAKEVANRQASRITVQGGILTEPKSLSVGQAVSFKPEGIPLNVKVEDIKDDYVALVMTGEGNDREFGIRVSYFDMPIVDNIKIDNTTRIAVLLTGSDKDTAKLRVASFFSDLAADRFDIKEMTRDIYSVQYSD